MKTLGIILAGGRGQRMGGADKGLLVYRGSTLVESVSSVMKPQVDAIVVSCNRNQQQYQALGHTTVADTLSDYQGPLAGVAAALEAHSCELALTVPCDCPYPATDLNERLTAALLTQDLDLAYAWDGQREQYLFSVMRSHCLTELAAYLATGERSVKGFLQLLRCSAVDFSDQPGAFHNFNTLQDLD